MSTSDHGARNTPDPLRAPGYSNRWERPYVVLTIDEIDMLRRLYESGEYTQAQLARKFDVDPSHVSRIVNGQRRKDNRR